MQLPDTPILKRATEEYRRQRLALLVAERELLDHVEEVAAQRRALPAGPRLPDYPFERSDGTRANLSDLFGQSDVLVVYNMMYGPHDEAPCPMCTIWVDSFNGVEERVSDTAPIAIASRASAAALSNLGRQRGWTTPLYASTEEYARDVGSEEEDGGQLPLITVFRKDPSGISLWYAQCANFPDGTYRGIDLLNPLWHLLDLLPQGRGDYQPPEVALATR